MKGRLFKYWYMITIYTCPVCGAEEVIRTRVYGKKPKNYNKTHEHIDRYDHCVE